MTHILAGVALILTTLLCVWSFSRLTWVQAVLSLYGGTLKPLRFNWIIAAVFLFVMVVPDQTADILRSLADDPWQQRLAATGVFLGAGLLATALWATSGELLHLLGHPPSPAVCATLAALPWAGLALSAALAALSGPGVPLAHRVPLLIGALLALAAGLANLAMLSAAASALRRPRTAPTPTVMPPSAFDRLMNTLITALYGATPLNLPILRLLTLFIGSMTALLLLGLWNPRFLEAVGPLAVVGYTLAFWTLLLGPFTAAWRLRRWPMLTILAALALVSGLLDLNDNHAIRTIPAATTSAPRTPDAAAAFDHWLAQRHPDVLADPAARHQSAAPEDPQRFPVYLVAAEGGGLRNAYWTAAVLSARAAADPGFRRGLFAVSGVSGGSVGAAAYAAAVRADQSGLVPLDPATRARMTVAALARSTLGHDYLSPVLAMGFGPDLAQQFFPIPVETVCRAAALESAAETFWGGAAAMNPFARGFLDLRAGGAAPSDVPHLLLNSTDVATGERIVTGHFRPRRGFPLLHDWLPEDRDVRLSTAAFLSSRFPFVTPAGSVPLPGGKARLVDGGYFENSAAATALDVLHELLDLRTPGAPRPWWWNRVEFRIIAIQFIEPAPPPGQGPRSGPHRFGDPLSPLRALFATRTARGSAAVADLERYLTLAPAHGIPVSPTLLHYEAVSSPTPLPLGWFLSPAARQSMDTQAATLIPPRTPTPPHIP